MGRVKIKFPAGKPLFETSIRLRIADINYGNHLGHDALISLLHDARMQWLAQWGYTELQAGGLGLILADLMVSYKSEAFYGDLLRIRIFLGGHTERSFELLYQVDVQRNEAWTRLAEAQTGMVSFDYGSRRVATMTVALKKCIGLLEN